MSLEKSPKSSLQTENAAQTKNVSLNRKLAGSNWEKALTASNAPAKVSESEEKPKKPRKKKRPISKYVAMDCEMVGTGPNGNNDMLARVSIVSQTGEVLLDKFVKPREKVTDYRTQVSGIRPQDIANGEEFDKVQDEVVDLLQEKILVGHSISNDLRVLYIKHPKRLIRDTSKYRPLADLVSNGATPSLKRLTKAILGLDIQTGEHNSVEDARATMNIYNRVSVEWEKYIKKQENRQNRYNSNR